MAEMRIRLERYLETPEGDGSAFGLAVRLRCRCGKHWAEDYVSWKNGPPKIEVRHMKEDEFGQEWVDLDGVLDYLKPFAQECPICAESR